MLTRFAPLALTLTLSTPALATDPEPAPITPEPTPIAPAPLLTPLPAEAAASLAPAQAKSRMANAGRVELSATTELSAYFSDSLGATTRYAYAPTPQLRLGVGLTDELVLSLGWRSVIVMNRADSGYDLTTSGDGILVTARYEHALTDWFALAAELDLEALHVDYELSVGAHSGTADTWGLGAMPKIVALTRMDLGGAWFDFRLYAGLALRTLHHADALRLSSSAARVDPIDLGTLDLNAFITGMTVSLSF